MRSGMIIFPTLAVLSFYCTTNAPHSYARERPSSTTHACQFALRLLIPASSKEVDAPSNTEHCLSRQHMCLPWPIPRSWYRSCSKSLLLLQYVEKRDLPDSSQHPLRRGGHDDSRSRGRLGRRCRGCSRAAHGLAGGAGHLDINPIVALLALELAIVLVLLAAVARCRLFRLGLWLGLGWRGPAGDLPDDSGEALEREASLTPLAAGLARPIESPQASIDGALISLGAKFMSRCRCIRWSWGGTAVIDSTVLPMMELVNAWDNWS